MGCGNKELEEVKKTAKEIKGKNRKNKEKCGMILPTKLMSIYCVSCSSASSMELQLKMVQYQE